MASFTYSEGSEGCCSLFRTFPCIICLHKVSSYSCTKALFVSYNRAAKLYTASWPEAAVIVNFDLFADPSLF